MSLQDPIADFLTRIRNAQRAGKNVIQVFASKIKTGIAEVLKNEGYIRDYQLTEENGKKSLVVVLKYHQNKPVIEHIKRISKTSCQYYASKDKLPVVLGGLGISIITTSQGIMTASHAASLGIGGEVICNVY
jgi:small subunit ribosomal protein S8